MSIPGLAGRRWDGGGPTDGPHCVAPKHGGFHGGAGGGKGGGVGLDEFFAIVSRGFGHGISRAGGNG